MIRTIIAAFFLTALLPTAMAQDSTLLLEGKSILLSEVVVNNQLNVPAFIDRIKKDSSFYKAFRNLHLLNFTSINDIRLLNKSGDVQASLFGKTHQIKEGACRRMEIIEEKSTGDFYKENRAFNYYTAQLYASFFFTNGTICGEDNIVGTRTFTLGGKSGLEKHKEQLKTLFFNPGKAIKGIPFMGNKTAMYDEEMASLYDMSIDFDEYNKTSCYIFKQVVKPGKESDVVVNEMTTWMDDKTFEVVARNYALSYAAGVYDFKVQMEVQMTHAGQYLVPALIRYTGDWKVLFKKRERGIFTATLFDFK